jgi:hypothetical protein
MNINFPEYEIYQNRNSFGGKTHEIQTDKTFHSAFILCTLCVIIIY